MSYKLIATALVTSFLVFSTTAFAQDSSFIGLKHNRINGTIDPDDASESASDLTLETALMFNSAPNYRFVVEGHYTKYLPEPLFDDDMESEAEISAHYLRDTASGNMTYGAFVSIGASVPDAADDIHYAALGGQAVYDLNDAFTLYGQLGAVRTVKNESGSGAYNGPVLRIGAYYEGFQNTSLYLDIEAGSANGYEDADEDGEFYKLSLGGETALNDGPLALTYEASSLTLEALNDFNRLETVNVSLGVRYYFGGGNERKMRDAGYIGTPDLIGSANTYVDALN